MTTAGANAAPPRGDVAGSVAEFRALAEECARVGGSVLQAARRDGPRQVREKAWNDFVTEVDAASEAAIHGLLRERRPGDAILAEEATTGGTAPATPPQPGLASCDVESGKASAAAASMPSARRASGDRPARPDAGVVSWVVDPLDGTKNFIHGYPAYAVSVAARGREGLLAGAVYDVTREELFSAGRAEGATLNGAPIRVTSVEPRRALVGTGFPFRHGHLVEPYLDSFRRVMHAVSDVRRGGSASLDLAYVACGRLDGFWELALSPWDIAAGWLLIDEAGGRLTDDLGGGEAFERGHVVAGGAGMHAVLLELVGPAFAGRVEAFPGRPPRAHPEQGSP
jgi:myo-inositol-1(or 4)-monophosphatase